MPASQSVRIRQLVAAILLVATNIIQIVFQLTQPLIIESCSDIEEFYTISIYHTVIVDIIFIASWALLCSTAANRATRIASIIAMAAAAISCCAELVSVKMAIDFFADVETSDAMLALNTVLGIYTIFLMPLMWVYVYSLLLRANDNIASNDRSWINLLIIAAIANYATYLYSFVSSFVLGDSPYNIPPILSSWATILLLVKCFAEFRMAKSAAFMGNYSTESAKGAYSPINKYFLAMIIAVPIIIGLWLAVFSNADFFESI